MTATLTLSALSVADAAKLLSKVSGETITEAMLLADRLAGAPANRDETLNIVDYTAWLVKESEDGN